VAQDAETIEEVLVEFDALGYATQLVALEGGRIRAAGATKDVDAADAHVVACRRLEGASDPADEVLVAALDLPDGSKGTLVLGYGFNAGPADSDVLLRLDLPV